MTRATPLRRLREKNVMRTQYFPDASPERVVRVTEKVFPAVVRIDVAQETYSEGKRQLRRGIGRA